MGRRPAQDPPKGMKSVGSTERPSRESRLDGQVCRSRLNYHDLRREHCRDYGLLDSGVSAAA